MNATNRARVQAVYDAVVNGVKTRYGDDLLDFGGVSDIIVDEAGQVTALLVKVTVGATDADGDVHRQDKVINVW